LNKRGENIMYKVLIADDQVPESNLTSEDEVRNYYVQKYKDIGFAEGFVFLYKMIKTLKAQGYEVDSVNKPDDIDNIKDIEKYNAIVLDLGWWTIEDMGYDDKMVLGWSMAEQIRKLSAAPIIMFSNRFYEDYDLAKTAADKALLPVYKSYDDACLKHILVTIRFAVMTRGIKELLSDEQKLYAFKMYKRLSNVLFYTISASVILLLISVVLVAIEVTATSVVSSAFGFICTFINGAIFRYVRQYRRDFI